MISKLLHAGLTRLGYWTRRTVVLPRGIEYLFDVQRLAARYRLPIEVIIDVGAHTGQSVGAFHRLWPEALILAIEADPDTYAQLIKAPISRHAECLNLALSDVHGQAEFHRFGANATCNSLLRNNEFAKHTRIDPVSTIPVRCDTLDNVVRDHRFQAVDFIKIDTEGHELKVLDGASETLSQRGVKFIFLEFNRITSKGGDQSGALAPLAEKLEDLGFSFVATYPELAIEDETYFSTSNALFFRNVRTKS